MHFIDILYSKKLKKYYIGETHDVNLRLEQHNQGFYEKNSFTQKGQPWELVFQLECATKKQAQKIEKHIKKMKSKKYIQNFIKYKEIQEKLLCQYIDQEV